MPFDWLCVSLLHLLCWISQGHGNKQAESILSSGWPWGGRREREKWPSASLLLVQRLRFFLRKDFSLLTHCTISILTYRCLVKFELSSLNRCRYTSVSNVVWNSVSLTLHSVSIGGNLDHELDFFFFFNYKINQHQKLIKLFFIWLIYIC